MSSSFAIFRVVPSDDWRWPVLPEVSVDNGATWHPIAAATLDLQEAADDLAYLSVKVPLLNAKKRA